MQFDDLLLRFFGTTDMDAIAPAAREAGVERMRVEFGLERDPAKRFVIWALLAMNDAEPDLDIAFENEAEREAARNPLDLVISARED
ncbi:hypothetical protein EKN06_08705 [Croceicoccus ponticola]|uniref:Uncharacterized protein n=1 Tax=Croceicoccus ponticola TaxID=2217664 RepID=A0A437GXV9_9SPHN|nr:hypothetical protein [Croceicoccus ponticola]RVQ67011.1 hypothetical protein EKN06_08705 [Croceicoccus ponticola]